MLLAGWEVRIGKNCGRCPKNGGRGCRPRAAFNSSLIVPIQDRFSWDRRKHPPKKDHVIFSLKI